MLLLSVLLLSVWTLTLIAATAAEVKTYQARYAQPCGRSVLELRIGGKMMEVTPVGKNPVLELKQYVLSNTQLRVRGYFNENRSSQIQTRDCSPAPEFTIIDYQADGNVSRCTTTEQWLLMESVLSFAKDLPDNQFSESDFLHTKESGKVKTFPLQQCHAVSAPGTCKNNEWPANSCDLTEFWCCS